MSIENSRSFLIFMIIIALFYSLALEFICLRAQLVVREMVHLAYIIAIALIINY